MKDTTYTPGTAVKFLPEWDDGSNEYPIKVIEDNGDRLFVRIENGMNIAPQEVVRKEWVVAV